MKAHLQNAWEELKAIYYEHLEEYGVKLPAEGTAKQIWLAMLYDSYKKNPDQLIDKNEISREVIEHLPGYGTDQQIRHLKRDGWRLKTPKRGFHCLDPYKPSPSFAQDAKRKAKILAGGDFETIKQEYEYRCATCGIEEGKTSSQYDEPAILEQGHMDPEKPQVIGNVIPQCQFCNKAYKSDFVFNEKGRIRAIADIGPVKRASKKVQKKVWSFLSDKMRKGSR